MRALSPRIESEGIRATTRSAPRSLREAVMRAVPGVLRRFTGARWLVEVLVVLLAGLLVAAAGLYGLAVWSTRVPDPNPLTADRLIRADHQAEANELGVWVELGCCREAR